ncbi:MAG: nitroreductase family protein [Clostridium sp.]|nr:nitroreductase family protein [Clostridium sp.]
MKTVKETLLERRSIRRYERDQVPAESMELIYNAIRNTPTSYNGQQFSVVDVTDQNLKLELYEMTGQKQIKTCNHFLAFCSDFNKIAVAAKAKGLDMPPITDTLDGEIIGTVDAALAMMSAVVAAESEGLGTCCIGYARTANPEGIAQLLGLPRGVFVVCGLAIGVPRELPDLKPKQPLSLVIHHNRYRDDDLAEDLIRYDKEVAEYNRTRSGSTTENDWAAHMLGYYREALKYNLLEALRNRGYDILS